METKPLVAVIGGGISGLATAFCLQQTGMKVLILEKKATVGGTMKTVFEDGYLIDKGPNSALDTTPLIRKLLTDIGIPDEQVYANPAADNRYVLRNGYLHALPMSPLKFFKSGLFSTKAKLRLFLEPFIAPSRNDKEESVAEFVMRRLGKEFLDYAINPFIAGVYAGNPRELSVRHAVPKVYALEQKYGSLIKGQIRGIRERKKRADISKHTARLFSFYKGMETFTNALGQVLKDSIVTNATVTSIDPVENSKKQIVSYINEGQSKQISVDAVFLAIPSYDAAEYIQPHSFDLARMLREIPYAPAAVVFFGARKDQCTHPLDGFGFLVPEVEKRRILGTIWSSSIFQNRAPDGHVALTTFVGGTRQPEMVDYDDKTLTNIVKEELRELIGFQGDPAHINISRWNRAIPQYVLGYGKMLSEIDSFEERYPGFFIGGNFRHGIGIGDCIKNAYEIADRIKQYLNKIIV